MSIQTKAQLLSAITADLADNTTGLITPQRLRSLLTTIVDTCFNEAATPVVSVPVGGIIYIAYNSVPTGFLSANGQAVSRSTFAALFAVIGTIYGTGDGSSTFNVPDLRAEFIRGFDGGRGLDPNRQFGSRQNELVGEHTHIQPSGWFGQSGNNWFGYMNFGRHVDGAVNTVPIPMTGVEGAPTENRPRNIALLPCIKF